MKTRTIVLIAFFAILVAGILGMAVIRPATPAQATTAAEPPFQLAERPITAQGELVPLSFARLSFETGGTAVQILVEEGKTVAVGDPLIRLDTRDLDIALEQAQAQLAAAQAGRESAAAQLALAQAAVQSAQDQVIVAQAQLELINADPQTSQVSAAEGRLAAAEAAVLQAQGQRDAALEQIGTEAQIQAAEAQLASSIAERQRLQKQYDQIIDACFETPDGEEVCPLYGPVEEMARAQLQAAEAAVAAATTALDQLQAGPTPAQQQAASGAVLVAQANRDLAQAHLDLLLAGASPEVVQQVAVGVEQAQVNVEIAQTQVGEAQASVEVAEAGVQAAQAGIEAVDAACSRMTLTAPFAGTVTTIDVNPGELVAPGRPVLVLADTNQWLVETTDLTELDVARIATGDAVAVTLDALPAERLSGSITKIALVASQSQGDTVYKATILLAADSALPLRWGMTAQVEFVP